MHTSIYLDGFRAYNKRADLRKEIKKMKNLNEINNTSSFFDWETAAKANRPSGLVSAFCQNYNAEEAINHFCNGLLKQVRIDKNGEVVYQHESKAFHGSFAISPDKTLCAYTQNGTIKYMNAFDIVLFLSYASLDSGISADLPKNKWPSYLEFQTVLKRDERMAPYFKANQFGIKLPYEPWMDTLEFSAKSELKSNYANHILIIKNDKVFKNLGFDEHLQIAVKTAPFDWEQNLVCDRSFAGGMFNDVDYAYIKARLALDYGMNNPKTDYITDGIRLKAQENHLNTITDFFNNIRENVQWDGTSRVKHIYQTYFGVEDNPYYRFLSASTIMGIVSRTLATGNGVQFDIVPLLFGAQGIGKTSFCRELFLPNFYSCINSIDEKNLVLKIGFGICELSEAEILGGRQSTARVKTFITKQFDLHRFPYEKQVVRILRQSIFIMSTNKKDGLLRDDTGNRRFWPVICGKAYRPGDITDYERNQIYAEALAIYDAGKQNQYLYTDNAEILEYANKLRKDFEPNKELLWAIHDYIEENGATEICAKEVYIEILKRYPSDYQLDVTRRNMILSVLRNLDGWEEDTRRSIYKQYGKQQVYRKSNRN